MATRKRKPLLTLYLSSWQKRMMKDFMPKTAFKKKPLTKITKLLIRDPIRGCLVSYKIPPHGILRNDWLLYLTDEQINLVGEQLNLRTPITSINISPEFMKEGGMVFA